MKKKNWKDDMIKQWNGYYSKAFVDDWKEFCEKMDYALLTAGGMLSVAVELPTDFD